MNAIVKIGETEFQPVRFTRAAIVELTDSPLFEQLGRVEIIDGVMIQMSPSWLPHSRAMFSVSHALANAMDDRLKITVDQLVLFGDAGMHAPDIAFFDKDFSKREPDSADLRFVIEIAEASLEYDLGTKADRYAAFGIPEYWVVDLENHRTVVHLMPTAEGYADVVSHSWTEALSPRFAPDVAVAMAEVLG